YLPPDEGVPKAKEACQRALQLDPNLGLALAALGAVQAVFEFDWDASERSILRGIAAQPSLALAHRMHGMCLAGRRRLKEAIAAIERSLALDPFDAFLRSTATYIYSAAGDYTTAIQNFNLGIAINPNNPLVYRSMALAHQAQGRLDLAVPV